MLDDAVKADPRVEIVLGDLTDKETMEKVVAPDGCARVTVIHLASVNICTPALRTLTWSSLTTPLFADSNLSCSFSRANRVSNQFHADGVHPIRAPPILVRFLEESASDELLLSL